jgi:hypothetical protein
MRYISNVNYVKKTEKAILTLSNNLIKKHKGSFNV